MTVYNVPVTIQVEATSPGNAEQQVTDLLIILPVIRTSVGAARQKIGRGMGR